MPSISKASLMEPAKRDAEKCILPHPFVEEAYLCHQQCRNWLHSLFLTCFSPSALPAEEYRKGFIRLTELCYKSVMSSRRKQKYIQIAVWFNLQSLANCEHISLFHFCFHCFAGISLRNETFVMCKILKGIFSIIHYFYFFNRITQNELIICNNFKVFSFLLS